MTRSRAAAWLWILWAFVVWNVVFDRVIVDAGRDYVDAAYAAAKTGGPYQQIDEAMRPARSRALVLATASAGVILVVGFLGLRRAGRPTSEVHPRKT